MLGASFVQETDRPGSGCVFAGGGPAVWASRLEVSASANIGPSAVFIDIRILFHCTPIRNILKRKSQAWRLFIHGCKGAKVVFGDSATFFSHRRASHGAAKRIHTIGNDHGLYW